MFCSKCGAQNADGAGFCSNCGSPLQQPQVEGGPQAGTPEQKIRIEVPSFGDRGGTIGVVGLILGIVSIFAVFASAPIGALMGVVSIILGIRAAVLGDKSLKDLKRNYYDIAMQNPMYYGEYNRIKGDMYAVPFLGGVSIGTGIIGLFLGICILMKVDWLWWAW